MDFLSGVDIVNLDTAMSDKEARKHLVKAYVGMTSPGFDECPHYTDMNDYAALWWARDREINLRNFKVRYQGRCMDQDKVLLCLVKNGVKEVAEYLATRCSNVGDSEIDVYNSTSDTMIPHFTLMMAAEKGYVETVRALVGREGTNVNKSDGGGNTALHKACYESHTEIVQALLEAGADIDRPNNIGETALIMACSCGKAKETRDEVILLLLAAGADTNAETNEDSNGFSIFVGGRTALHYAIVFGSVKSVLLLLDAGADVKSQNFLFQPSSREDTEKVQLLREAGASEPGTPAPFFNFY